MNEGRRNLFAWFLLAMGIFLLVGGLITVFINRQPAAMLTATPATAEEVQRVAVDEAKKAFDEGAAVFVDVRSANAYEASHIPGALSIPSNELLTRIGQLEKDAWIIPY